MQDSLNEKLGAVKLVYYWSLIPGNLVIKDTGIPVSMALNMVIPTFTGTVAEWNEVLYSTIDGLLRDMVPTRNTLTENKDADKIYVPETVLHHMSATSQKWHGVLEVCNELPYDHILVEADSGEFGIVKVLSLNPEGALQR